MSSQLGQLQALCSAGLNSPSPPSTSLLQQVCERFVKLLEPFRRQSMLDIPAVPAKDRGCSGYLLEAEVRIDDQRHSVSHRGRRYQ